MKNERPFASDEQREEIEWLLKECEGAKVIQQVDLFGPTYPDGERVVVLTPWSLRNAGNKALVKKYDLTGSMIWVIGADGKWEAAFSIPYPFEWME